MTTPTRPATMVLLLASLSLAAAPDTQPTGSDQKFVISAAGDGLKEVALGRLASNQGESPDVRECGRMMVADHTTANDQLLTIAMQENVKPPKDLTASAQSTYDKLAALHGKAFDQAFLSAMVDDHKEDVTALQDEIDHGSDMAVKDWARSTLPVIKRHLAMVQEMSTKMGG